MKAKIHNFVGSIGALIGTFVFIAYIPQIMANLAGDKGQPLVAAFSCLLWVIYGFTNTPKRDYILITPNLAGVVLGTITFITSL